jgi:hypothetical protein
MVSANHHSLLPHLAGSVADPDPDLALEALQDRRHPSNPLRHHILVLLKSHDPLPLLISIRIRSSVVDPKCH